MGPRARRAGAVRRVLRGVHLERAASHDPRARPRRVCSPCTRCRSARTSPAPAPAVYAGDPELVRYLVRGAQARRLHGPRAGAGRRRGGVERRRPRRRAARALPAPARRDGHRARQGGRRRPVPRRRVLPVGARARRRRLGAGPAPRRDRRRARVARASSTDPRVPGSCGWRSCNPTTASPSSPNGSRPRCPSGPCHSLSGSRTDDRSTLRGRLPDEPAIPLTSSVG